MDIQRPSNARRKRLRAAGTVVAVGVALILITAGLGRLKRAEPTVEAATLWPDAVKRGPMVREVRGLGALVPEDIRWIPASTEGRVERVDLRPGTPVTPDSVILQLSNPELEQLFVDASLKLQAAQAALASLRVQLQNDLLQQRAASASIESEYTKAQMQADMNDALAAKQLVSALAQKQSRLDAEQLAVRRGIAAEQLQAREEAGRAQIAVQQSSVDQARAVLQLRERQRDALRVRAGIGGVLQLVLVDVGQQVAPGANLARVANPGRLKAEIKIAETQAKDVQIGQHVSIDTRNGIVAGHVTRLDPSVQNGTRTVDVSLDEDLPKGAVPDLTVDGTIELERLSDVLFVGRPAFGQEQSRVAVFKVDPSGASASRVQVQFGRSSVNTVEVVSGLQAGDRIILSDMSAWDGFDRVRLK